jgi:hypothetical protein
LETKKFKDLNEAFRFVKYNVNHIDVTLAEEQKIVEQNRIDNIKKQVDDILIDNFLNIDQLKNHVKYLVENFNKYSKKSKIDVKVNDDKSITVFLTSINKNSIEIKSETTYKTLKEFMKWIKIQKMD